MSKYGKVNKQIANDFIINLKSYMPVIDVDEWKMSFNIKLFNADFAFKIQAMSKDENGKIIDTEENNVLILYVMLQYSLVDDDENELYDMDQIIKLTNNQLSVVTNLFYKILELNGMSKESMEKIQKNFFDQQNANLLTNLPVI